MLGLDDRLALVIVLEIWNFRTQMEKILMGISRVFDSQFGEICEFQKIQTVKENKKRKMMTWSDKGIMVIVERRIPNKKRGCLVAESI